MDWRKPERIAALAIAGALASGVLHAEDAQVKPQADSPGRALLAAKCFQCHNDAMFRDQRQDRRAWESTLYRMVGRGALWTREEIQSMAEYLAVEYGPQVPPSWAKR